MVIKMQIQENIKKYRVAKQLTQEDLAEKLNVSRQTISKWEQGINEPNIDTIKELCVIFDVSIDEFLGINKTTKRNSFPLVAKICNLFSIGLCIFISLILIAFTRYLYKKIPMHYNWAGQVDRYGSKWEWLYLLPCFIITLIIDLLCSKKIEKDGVVSKKDKIGFWIVKVCCWCCQIIELGIFFGFASAFIKKDAWYPIINCVVYAFLFSLFIFMHPRIVKQNSYFGFRTSFTCSNELAWNKINRFSCWVLCINCITVYILQMFINQFWLNFILSNCLYIGAFVIWMYYIRVKYELK